MSSGFAAIDLPLAVALVKPIVAAVATLCEKALETKQVISMTSNVSVKSTK